MDMTTSELCVMRKKREPQSSTVVAFLCVRSLARPFEESGESVDGLALVIVGLVLRTLLRAEMLYFR